VADNYKILAQFLPPNNSAEHVVYTVPSAAATTIASTTSSPFNVAVAPKAVSSQTQTIISSIIVCNVHSGAVTYNIRLKGASTDADNDKEMLFYTTSIPTAKTHVLSLGLGLSAGNLLKVKISVASKMAFTIMGTEVT
jgi:hypothetical protein